MIAIDHYVIDFVKENAITLYIAITLAKAVAVATPSNLDNTILGLVSTAYKAARTGKIPLEKPEDK